MPSRDTCAPLSLPSVPIPPAVLPHRLVHQWLEPVQPHRRCQLPAVHARGLHRLRVVRGAAHAAGLVLEQPAVCDVGWLPLLPVWVLLQVRRLRLLPRHHPELVREGWGTREGGREMEGVSVALLQAGVV